jgi:NADP-dependent 3-hydroxy acid dehydrogenase YdfG
MRIKMSLVVITGGATGIGAAALRKFAVFVFPACVPVLGIFFLK